MDSFAALSRRMRLILLAAFGLLALAAGGSIYVLMQEDDTSWKICSASAILAPEARISACTKVIDSGRESAKSLAGAHNNRGSAHRDLGDDERALADFNAAIKLDAGSPYLYINRGNALLKSGELKGAIADFNAAIYIDESAILAVIGRGNAFLRQGQPAQAIVDFNRAVTLDPRSPTPVYRRAIAHARLRHIEEALADYDKAIDLDPSDWSFWNGRCWFRATEGVDLDLALKDCDEAVRLNPKSTAAIDSRAFVFLKLGRLEEALAAYDLVIAKDPNNAWPLYGRGLAKKRLGDGEGGAADMGAAEAKKPGVGQEYLKYGEGMP
jgi:tetratricopeptide (TPR) repeat protein